MNFNLDQTSLVSCNGCSENDTSTLDVCLDWARNHHDVFDHEPYKDSREPDLHNSFSVSYGDSHILGIETSSMNARLMYGDRIIYTKHYFPSGIERF